MDHRHIVIVCAGVLLIVACSQRAEIGSVCLPGATQQCACTDGRTGAQSCSVNGDLWNGCYCSDHPLSQSCTQGTGRGEQGCSKVDFLFVVDNSLSMDRAQAKLREAFPNFMATVHNSVRAQDYHVMVVDTDGVAPEMYDWGRCELPCTTGAASFPSPAFNFAFDSSCHNQQTPTPECQACGGAPTCCLPGSRSPRCDVVGGSIPACDASIPTDICEGTAYGTAPPPGWCANYECGEVNTLDTCDVTLGAGVRHPIAPNASNTVCEFAGGRRYMTSEDTNTDALFACSAQVGSFGYGHEQPVGAMLEALSAQFNESGGCNEGFLRPDALLVVTFLTDANADSGSVEEQAGIVDVWRQELIAAKCGNEQAVVLLGLLGDSDLPDGTCEFGAPYASSRVRSLVQSFGENGFAGSICADEYGTFFATAVDRIDSACELLLY